MNANVRGVSAVAIAMLAVAVSPAAGQVCPLINCDCDNIDAGFLTEAWKEECRSEEAKIKAECLAGKTELSCAITAQGPAAYPKKADDTAAPIDAWVDQYANRLADESGMNRVFRYHENRPALQLLATHEPSLAIFDAFSVSYAGAMEANFEMQAALFDLLPDDSGEVAADNARSAAIEMVAATAALEGSGPENPIGLHKVGKQVERLAAAGIGVTELADGNAESLKTLEKAAKFAKLGADLATLEETGEVKATQFVNDVLGIIPKEASPALAGPAGKFFRDLMGWNQKMWNSSTDGLNLVADAIETGKIDIAEYGQVTEDLETLAAEGPWGAQTGKDFIKKTAEELPVVGKLLKALWS